MSASAYATSSRASWTRLLWQSRAAAKKVIRWPGTARARYRERCYAARAEHELAICAIFREEASFLDEWLTFHAGIGATHFYLYNNFSTDNFRDILEPWLARGMVTLRDWPIPVGQLSAYRDCVRRAWQDCRWIAFIDLDEFLFSPKCIDIRSILRDYQDLPGLEVWQLFFGSGGLLSRSALPVTEAFRRRATIERATVKTIANPRFVYKPGVHQFKYWQGQALDPARRPVSQGQRPVLDRLRINHYWSRSLQDLATKVARGDASTAATRNPEWHSEFERSLNAETDECILPIARSVRSRYPLV
jgi:hypothetical protein